MSDPKAIRLSRDDIVSGLAELVECLRADGTATGIYIVGGAALALRYDSTRGTTSDVDAKIYPRSSALHHASLIAKDRGWPDDWLNSSADIFIPVARDAGWEPVWDDGVVSLWVASAECLLVMKLRASRRGRDGQDIANLMVLLGIETASDAEALFEAYFPGEVLQQKAFDILGDIFTAGLPPAPTAPPLPDFGGLLTGTTQRKERS